VIKSAIKKEEKPHSGGKMYYAAGLLLLLLLLIYGYAKLNENIQTSSAAFKVKDIEIKGNYLVSRTEVLKLIGVKGGNDQQVVLKPADISKRLAASPYIQEASAVRSLPARLRIVIEEKVPVAFIYGQGLNLIDETGILMPVPENQTPLNLPLITGINEALGTLGSSTRSKSAMKAVEILNYLKFMKTPLEELISEINVKDKNTIHLILIRGGAQARISVSNYHENLYVLNQYVHKYLDWKELAKIEYFDVRFKNQFIIKDKQS